MDRSYCANVSPMAVTHVVPGAILTEREHSVPLDHADPDGPKITVFTREVADPDGRSKPYLLFLQGGPGGEATRPTSPPVDWIKRALRDYRVLLLDQRGTGRSTPVGRVVPGADAREQAVYLAHFRADAIVRDAELIRHELGVERWSVLGQSFGGFCSLTYLSFAPDGLREVLITGGLATLTRPIDEVYRLTYERTIEANEAFFARYPGDRQRARDIMARLEADDVRLPDGDRLTARRFRQLGNMLGFSGGMELLHHVLELPFGSTAFLEDATSGAPRFGRNPLYATLHEACWANGGTTNWAAARLLPSEMEERGYFTAEHIFPWMYEDYGELQPQAGVAQLLAEHEWGPLYDPAALAANEVPVAAAIYFDDPFVVREHSLETAAAVRGLRYWITNEFLHNGLRAHGDRVLGTLIDMVRGRA